MMRFKGMMVLGMSLAASLAMAVTPAAKIPTATPGFDDVKPFMDAVHSGQINPETYDFEAAGFFKLTPDVRGNWLTLVFQVVGQTYPPDISECSTVRQQNGAVMAWVLVLTQSKDAADWKANAEALRGREVGQGFPQRPGTYRPR